MSGLHGIGSCRLVYNKMIELQLNYKKSYFWWFGNPACGDSTGSNRIEKDQVRLSPRFVWGKRGEGLVRFSVWSAFSWLCWCWFMYVEVLFTCGERGFNSLGSWSYSKEWVWNLGTKSMLHCFWEVKCQLGDTLAIWYYVYIVIG